MLNARLATTESMTHDVIRDMLGVKMNMATWAVGKKIPLFHMLPILFLDICYF